MSKQATGDQAQDQAQQADTHGRKYVDEGAGEVTGNLTRDPEVKFTPSGAALCSLRVAFTPRRKDEQSGQWVDDPTVYFNVTCWRQMAYNVAESLSIGDRIVAIGRWQRTTWYDDEGNERTDRALIARELGPSLQFVQARLIKRPKGSQS